MSLRNNLWISALMVVAAVIPASAEDNPSSTTPPAPSAAQTFTRSFTFAPFGLANSTTVIENGRVAVENVAEATAKGSKPSCSGTISFTNGTGSPVGSPTAFNNLPTGQIFTADVIGASPSSKNIRNEFTATVALTITPGSTAPCSLLVRLSIYDAVTGATHSMDATTVETTPPGAGVGLRER